MVYAANARQVASGVWRSLTKKGKRNVGKALFGAGVAAAGGGSGKGGGSMSTQKGKGRNVRGKRKRRRKRRSPEYLESTQHNDLSHGSFAITLKRPSKFFKSLGDFQYLITYMNRMTNLEGRQGIFSLRAFNTANSFINTTTTRNDQELFPEIPFSLNPYLSTTGGGVIGAVVTPAPDYVHLKTIDCMLMVQNTSNVAQSIDLNFFMCRKTTNLDPYAAWNYAMLQKRLGQSAPIPSTSTGVLTASPGYADSAQYGFSPFSEKTFNKLWKCQNRFVFDLQPGGTRKFLYKIHVNRTFSKAEQNSYSVQGTTYVANQTIVPMIITRPSLATIADANQPTEVTVAQASIAVMMSNHYTWSSLAAPRLEYDRVYQGIVLGVPGSHTDKKETIVGDLDTLVNAFNL